MRQNIKFSKLVKHYVSEAAKIDTHFERLEQALTAVETYLTQNNIVLDPSEHQKDEADPTGVRGPFMYGGINYGETKDKHYKILSIKERPTRKYLHISIYRMETGRYELTFYVS